MVAKKEFTKEDLRANVSIEGDHWIWTGTTNFGNPNAAPRFGKTYVRNWVWDTYRKETRRSDYLITTCLKRGCVHPEHLMIDPNELSVAATRTSGQADATLITLERIESKLDELLARDTPGMHDGVTL